MKLPAFQFYPGDWMKDPALRRVSVAARGLWIDMLCLMHENDRRGYLQLPTGKPVSAEQLARSTGCSTDEASQLLRELEDSGVYSCTEHGVIYNRRMVADERRRQTNRENGMKGGNPLLGKSDNRKSNRPSNRLRNRDPTPSSSISISSSNTNTPPLPPCGGNVELQSVLADWLAYKAERGERYKSRGLAALETQFVEWGTERARAAVEFSKRNQYKGLFEPNTQPNRPKPSTFLFKPPSET